MRIFHHLYGWKWYNKKHVIKITFFIQECYKKMFMSAVKKNDFFQKMLKKIKNYCMIRNVIYIRKDIEN